MFYVHDVEEKLFITSQIFLYSKANKQRLLNEFQTGSNCVERCSNAQRSIINLVAHVNFGQSSTYIWVASWTITGLGEKKGSNKERASLYLLLLKIPSGRLPVIKLSFLGFQHVKTFSHNLDRNDAKLLLRQYFLMCIGTHFPDIFKYGSVLQSSRFASKALI